MTDLLQENKPIVLTTGVRAILRPAPALLIEEAANRIEYPRVPTQTIDGVERDNPNDPDYQAEIARIDRRRAQASLDTMLLFSLELVDGVPDNDTWVKKLRYLERLGHIDLGEYDLSDELDREFIYKKFIATSNDDWKLIGKINGIQQGDVDAFKSNTFQGDEARSTHRAIPAKA